MNRCIQLGLLGAAAITLTLGWVFGRPPQGMRIRAQFSVEGNSSGEGRVEMEILTDSRRVLELGGFLSDSCLGIKGFHVADANGEPLPVESIQSTPADEEGSARFTRRKVVLPSGCRRVQVRYSIHPGRYLPPNGDVVLRNCGWIAEEGCVLGLGNFLLLPDSLAAFELELSLPDAWSVAICPPTRMSGAELAEIWTHALIAWRGGLKREALAQGVFWTRPSDESVILGKLHLKQSAERLLATFGPAPAPIEVVAIPATLSEFEVDLPAASRTALWHAPVPGPQLPGQAMRTLFPLWFGRLASELAVDSSAGGWFAIGVQEFLAETQGNFEQSTGRNPGTSIENTWLRETYVRSYFGKQFEEHTPNAQLIRRIGGLTYLHALDQHYQGLGLGRVWQHLAGFDGFGPPQQLVLSDVWRTFQEKLMSLHRGGNVHFPFEENWQLCFADRPEGGRPTELPSKVVDLIFTADSKGFLETCGCKLSQNGGIARRATEVARLRGQNADSLLIDLGNFVPVEAGRRILEPLVEEELGLYLRSQSLIGYDAICIGPDEIYCGSLKVRTLDAEERIDAPFLGAGIRERGHALYPSARVIERAGLKIGFFAYTERIDHGPLRLAQSANLAGIEFPVQVSQVGTELRQLREEVDLLIVGGRMSTASLQELCRSEIGVDIVLLADPQEPTLWQNGPVGYLGRTLVAHDTQRNFGLNHLTLFLTETGGLVTHQFRSVDLTPAIHSHEGTQALLDDFYRALAQREDLTKGLGGILAWDARQEGGYVGSAACADCHSAEHQSWLATDHAQAMETLVGVRRDLHPKCVSCHVVGLGRPTGYDLAARQKELAGVGCETCHGAGLEHSQAPSRANIRRSPEAKLCLECHDSEHSDNFEARLPEAWKAILHH